MASGGCDERKGESASFHLPFPFPSRRALFPLPAGKGERYAVFMATKPRWPWISLIVLQVIQLLTLVPWLAFAGLAVMAFDAPGSTEKWQPWAFVLTIWSYPVWLVLAAAASWLLFYARWHKTAVGVAALFALPMPAIILLVMLAGWVA